MPLKNSVLQSKRVQTQVANVPDEPPVLDLNPVDGVEWNEVVFLEGGDCMTIVDGSAALAVPDYGASTVASITVGLEASGINPGYLRVVATNTSSAIETVLNQTSATVTLSGASGVYTLCLAQIFSAQKLTPIGTTSRRATLSSVPT